MPFDFGSSMPHTSNTENSQATTPVMNNLPQKSNDSPHKGNERTELLRAMKPYLSRDRQEAIDYIIKLGRLGDILKSL